MTHKLKRPVAFLSAFVMVMAMLLYFPSGMFSIDFGIKASAAEITPSQPKYGDGSEENPYQIGTAAELYWFAACVNGTDGVTQNTAANAVLTANITMNGSVLNTDGTLKSGSFTSWTPIGNSSNKYTGTFDGQNHTVSGLYFNDTNTDNVGLFGYNRGTVKNVGVVDSYFNGGDYVGGVCGENYYGIVSNCYNSGTVTGEYAGGVCGASFSDRNQVSFSGSISECFNKGTITGSSDAGGICGKGLYISIEKCYNTGKIITSYGTVGGICGLSNGKIKYCYNNTGDITEPPAFGPTTIKINSAIYYHEAGNLSSKVTDCYYNKTLYSKNEEDNGKTSEEFANGTICDLVGYHSIGLTVNQQLYVSYAVRLLQEIFIFLRNIQKLNQPVLKTEQQNTGNVQNAVSCSPIYSEILRLQILKQFPKLVTVSQNIHKLMQPAQLTEINNTGNVPIAEKIIPIHRELQKFQI